MLNCFLISGKPGQPSPKKNEAPVEQDSAVSVENTPVKNPIDSEAASKICVVFDETIIFLDEALNILKDTDPMTIDDNINWIDCLS